MRDGGPHILQLDNEKSLICKTLIVAVGCLPRWLGIPSEKTFYGKGVSACAYCDGPLYRGTQVCVVGGGDTAMEDALLLADTAGKVYLIHRRDKFRATKILQDKVLANPAIKIYYNHTVEEILGRDFVERIRIRDLISGKEEILNCSAYFSALGYLPNTAVFQNVLELDEQGYICTRNNSTQCSCAGVFAAGDCADPAYRQAVTAAGSGCRAAIDAARFLMQQ